MSEYTLSLFLSYLSAKNLLVSFSNLSSIFPNKSKTSLDLSIYDQYMWDLGVIPIEN